MPKYKPMLIHFDEEGYKRATRWAMDKVVKYNDAKRFAEKHIVVADTKAFAGSFTSYFKRVFMDSHRDKIQLEISVDKLLDLMDIDLLPLAHLESKYRDNKSLLSFDTPDGVPAPVIDKTQFETYTNSSEQNEVLRDTRRLIEAIQKVEQHTHVYPANFVAATSNLLGYDMRKGKYYPNLHNLRG